MALTMAHHTYFPVVRGAFELWAEQELTQRNSNPGAPRCKLKTFMAGAHAEWQAVGQAAQARHEQRYLELCKVQGVVATPAAVKKKRGRPSAAAASSISKKHRKEVVPPAPAEPQSVQLLLASARPSAGPPAQNKPLAPETPHAPEKVEAAAEPAAAPVPEQMEVEAAAEPAAAPVPEQMEVEAAAEPAAAPVPEQMEVEAAAEPAAAPVPEQMEVEAAAEPAAAPVPGQMEVEAAPGMPAQNAETDACTVFENEIEQKAKQLGLTAVILKSFEREEEEEEEEEEAQCGPSLAQLRSSVIVAYLPSAAADAIAAAREDLGMVGRDSTDDPICMRNTASSYEMYAIIQKWIKRASTSFKNFQYPQALHSTLAITLAASRDDHWYLDTDDTAKPIRIISKLAAEWRKLLALGDEQLNLAAGTRAALEQKLVQVALEWEEEAPNYGCDLKFKWKPKPAKPLAAKPSAPTSSPTERADGGIASFFGGSSNRSPQRSESTVSSESTRKLQQWVAALGDVKELQQASWQLRCISGKTLRVLIVPAAATMFALNRTIAAAFDAGNGPFEHHVNKGTAPANSFFLCDRGDDGQAMVCAKRSANGKPNISDRDVKVCQLVRQRGDKLSYQAGQLKVQVIADGVVSEKKPSIPLPRCVGADKAFKTRQWEALNKQFKGDRVGQQGFNPFCSKAELAKGMRKWSRIPLFDNTGALLDATTAEEAWQRVARPFV